jgi:nucleotide-binding universal stress UspA family protein
MPLITYIKEVSLYTDIKITCPVRRSLEDDLGEEDAVYGKILYATDFSDVAKKASQYVKGLWGSGARDVIILHVVDKRGIDSISSMTTIDALAMEQGWEEVAMNEISPVESELKDAGFSVQMRIEKGVPFKEIIRVADEENVSLIIIGSHGKSNIREMLLGSITEKVARKATKPVLIVKR